jgi:glucose/arabinose dehydrogenase
MSRRLWLSAAAFALASCSTSSVPSARTSGFSPNDEHPAPYSRDAGRSVAQVTEYNVDEQNLCDGFPRVLDVKTAPGLCVGLVDDGGGKTPLKMPRHLAAFGDDFVVTDMAGWGNRGGGKVFLLKKDGTGYKRYPLLLWSELPEDRRHWLYMPSTVKKGPEGLVYLGASSTILRFPVPFKEFAKLEEKFPDENAREQRLRELRQQIYASIQVVLDDLPYLRTGVKEDPMDGSLDSLHPLKPFVFDSKGDMFLGIGADSDNCGVVADVNKPCPETVGDWFTRKGARAVVEKYVFDAKRSTNPKRILWAEGLRNSLSIAMRPGTDELWQGENSREVRDAQKMNPLGPYDELNLVERGVNYGWPYCEEDGQLSREYATSKRDCSKFRRARLYFPPHSGPLDMFFYTGALLPSWYRGKLLVTYHSREKFGHRLVAFDADAAGQPTGRPLDVIAGWGSFEEKDQRVLGSPMGLAQASDGSIFVTEDKNRKILRLSVDTAVNVPAEQLKPAPSSVDDEWINRDL